MAPQRRSFPRLFLARTDPFRATGDRVFLRVPERSDYDAWASLRASSRDFLAPWEPNWPPDALSRASFRARVGRYAEDWRTDQAYNFFIFTHDDTLVGGIGPACTGSRPPACRRTSRADPCWQEPVSSRRGTPANTSASKANGKIICFLRFCAATAACPQPSPPRLACGGGRGAGYACPASVESIDKSMPSLASARRHFPSWSEAKTMSSSAATESQPLAW